MPTSPYYYNNQKLCSVSEILDYEEGNANLIAWAKRKEAYDKKNGDGAWDAMVEKSQDRGTTLHAMALETCILSGVDPREVYCPDWLKPYWEGNKSNGLKYWTMNLMEQDYEIIAIEKPFIHKELLYGGTPDLVIAINGQNWIWDLKTYKGTDRNYKPRKDRLEAIKKQYKIKTLDKSKTYKLYASIYFWDEVAECWMANYKEPMYQRYRKPKKGERAPGFKTWEWYSPKLMRAFKQCLLYRELLQHNEIPIHNLKVVCASKHAGVNEFTFFDRTLTNNMNDLIKLYNEAWEDTMAQVRLYHKNQSHNVPALLEAA